ncbi:DNA-binding response OmpR family regulator [Bradyrhizobium sp. AZCC 2289]
MRAHSTSRNKPDRMNSVFISADSRTSELRSASIHLLGSPTRLGQHRGSARGTQMPPALQDETSELLADVDGLPILVRFRLNDVPVEVRSDLVSNGADIRSLLSITLEKMVDRMRGTPLREEATCTQPLATVELISSGEPLVRLQARLNETVLRVGSLELDLMDRAAKRGDRKIDLRPREFQLLKYMMQRNDKLLTRETLLKEVWNYKFVPETNLVDVHMGRLRRKVDGSNEFPMIRNVRGAGFVLSATPLSRGSPPKPAERSSNPDVEDRSQRLLEGMPQ